MTPPIVKNRASSQSVLAPTFGEWQAPVSRLPPGVGAGRFWDANGKTVKRPFFERKKKESLTQNMLETKSFQIQPNTFEAKNVKKSDHNSIPQTQNKTSQEINMRLQKHLARDVEALIIAAPMPAPLRSHPPMEASQRSPLPPNKNTNSSVMVEKRSETVLGGEPQLPSVPKGRPIVLDRSGNLASNQVQVVAERPRSLLPGHARQSSNEAQSPKARARSIMQHELFLTDLPIVKSFDPVSPVVRTSTAPTPKTRELVPDTQFRQRSKSASHELFLSGLSTAVTPKSMPGSPRMGVALRDVTTRTRSPSPPPTPRKDTPKPIKEHISKPNLVPPSDPNVVSNQLKSSSAARPSLISNEAKPHKTHRTSRDGKSSSAPHRIKPESHPGSRARAKSVSQGLHFYATHRPNLKSSQSAQNLQAPVTIPNKKTNRIQAPKTSPARQQKATTTLIQPAPQPSTKTNPHPHARPEIYHTHPAPAKADSTTALLRNRKKPRPDITILNSHRYSMACYHSLAELPPSPSSSSSCSSPSSSTERHETAGFRSPQPGRYGDSKFNTLPGESYPFGQVEGPVELEASVPGGVGGLDGKGQGMKDGARGEFVLPQSLVVGGPDWDLLPLFARVAGMGMEMRMQERMG